MLTNALKEIKNLVFESNLEGNLEAKVGEIAENNGVEQQKLVPYFNSFSLMKINMDKRQVDTTKNLDWTDQEIEIVMMYMEDAKKEKMGVTEAFENLSELVFKTPSGIQYKYYEVKRKLKEGTTLKPETRGRKRKNAVAVVTVNNKEETTKDVVEQPAIQEPVAQEPIVEQPVLEEKVAETQPQTSVTELLKDRKERMARRKKQQEIANTVIEEPTSLTPQEQTNAVKPIQRSAERKDAVQLIGGMINNFRMISEVSGTFDANEQIYTLLEGLYGLSELAAKNAKNATLVESVKLELDLKEAQLNSIKEDKDAVLEEYHRLRSTVKKFVELNDVEQLAKLEEHNRQLKVVLDKNQVVAIEAVRS